MIEREQRERIARMERWTQLQEQMGRIDEAEHDLNNQKLYIERRRDEETLKEIQDRDLKVTRTGERYGSIISDLNEALRQANTEPEILDIVNQLNQKTDERNAKIQRIRDKSQKNIEDILQRHQTAIDGLDESLQQLERDQERVSSRIGAVEAEEIAAREREAQRAASLESAFGERTPSPSQDDVMRW